MTTDPVNEQQAATAAAAAENILGPNPIVGIRRRDLVDTGMALFRQMLLEPEVTARHANRLTLEVLSALAGQSQIEPEKKDRRFQDAAWHESWLAKALMQTHLAAEKEVKEWVGDMQLTQVDKERAEFVVSLLGDALSPSNSALNPAALRRAVDTGGLSFVHGLQHFVDDLVNNGCMPSTVDKSAFK